MQLDNQVSIHSYRLSPEKVDRVLFLHTEKSVHWLGILVKSLDRSQNQASVEIEEMKKRKVRRQALECSR